MKLIWIAAVLIGVLLSGCYAIDLPCTDEISPTVTPTQANLNPEETVQATYNVYTCGGAKELAVTPVWTSADTNIATVSDTGLITAQLSGGVTTITVSEAEYDTSATIRISVPVIDPEL